MLGALIAVAAVLAVVTIAGAANPTVRFLVRNSGAALSLASGMTWVFTVAAVTVTVPSASTVAMSPVITHRRPSRSTLRSRLLATPS